MSDDDDVSFVQINRSERNVVRDGNGRLRLGKVKVTKKLFSKNGAGAERYAKSMFVNLDVQCFCILQFSTSCLPSGCRLIDIQ